MAKLKLEDGEYAVQEGASFSINKTKGIIVNISPDGSSMDIIVTYKLNKPKDNLQVGPANIKYENAGVFITANPIKFKKVNKLANITLRTDNNEQVMMATDKSDIDVVTDGTKGREGNTTMLAQKNVDDSGIKKR